MRKKNAESLGFSAFFGTFARESAVVLCEFQP